MKIIFALVLASVLSTSAALAQVNTINSVVFGTSIPRYLADPTGGMPVRNTAADFLSVVPAIAGARAITFSPCSDTFLAVEGATASLWQTSNGAQNMALQHGAPIKFVAFGHDGTFCITCGNNFTRVWTAPRGEFKYQFDHKGDVTQMTISPDGTRLAVVTPFSFEMWSLTQGVNLLRTPVVNPIHELIFSPDGTQFLTLDGASATLWITADGQPVGSIRHESNIIAAIFSPNGRHVIFATERMSHLWDPKQFIKVADVQFGGGYR